MSGDDLGNVLLGIGTLLTGVGTVGTLLMSFRNRGSLLATQTTAEATHAVASASLKEVTTLNGKSIGQLADETQGRYIQANIDPADQTASEKHYVEALRQADTLTSQQEYRKDNHG